MMGIAYIHMLDFGIGAKALLLAYQRRVASLRERVTGLCGSTCREALPSSPVRT